MITSGQSNLTKSRITAAYGWFNGIQQAALVCMHRHQIHDSLGPSEPKIQTASQSVLPFLNSSPWSVHIQWTTPCPSKLPLLVWISGPHLTHGSLGPCQPISQTTCRSVQPFLHSSRQTVPILYNGRPFSPLTLPPPIG